MRPKLPLNAEVFSNYRHWCSVRDADNNHLFCVRSDGKTDVPAAEYAAFVVAACNMAEKVEALAKDWAYRAEACEDTATVSAQMGGGLVDIATTRAKDLREGAAALRDILKEVA